MSKPTSKRPASNFPEWVVCRDGISAFFDPPLPSSTFYDLVEKGPIVPMKGIRGRYLLNESLRRMGLREVSAITKSNPKLSIEQVIRFAFCLIDSDVFPEPSWMLEDEAIEMALFDHARVIVEQHAEKVMELVLPNLKLAYLQGVLDAKHLEEKECGLA